MVSQCTARIRHPTNPRGVPPSRTNGPILLSSADVTLVFKTEAGIYFDGAVAAAAPSGRSLYANLFPSASVAVLEQRRGDLGNRRRRHGTCTLGTPTNHALLCFPRVEVLFISFLSSKQQAGEVQHKASPAPCRPARETVRGTDSAVALLSRG